MTSIQEMSSWTTRDVEAAIQAALPRGWKFLLESEQGVFWVLFTDVEGKIAWTREGIDERLTLLDAFVWLQRKQQPATSSDAWKIRQREVPKPRTGPMSHPGVHIPDPQDLDPAEIDAVYREHLSRRK